MNIHCKETIIANSLKVFPLPSESHHLAAKLYPRSLVLQGEDSENSNWQRREKASIQISKKSRAGPGAQKLPDCELCKSACVLR